VRLKTRPSRPPSDKGPATTVRGPASPAVRHCVRRIITFSVALLRGRQAFNAIFVSKNLPDIPREDKSSASRHKTPVWTGGFTRAHPALDWRSSEAVSPSQWLSSVQDPPCQHTRSRLRTRRLILGHHAGARGLTGGG